MATPVIFLMKANTYLSHKQTVSPGNLGALSCSYLIGVSEALRDIFEIHKCLMPCVEIV